MPGEASSPRKTGMSNLLFDLPESLSPKMKWLRQHGLILRKLENGQWECALDAENFGRGETDEDACVDFCLKTKLAHWSAENI